MKTALPEQTDEPRDPLLCILPLQFIRLFRKA